MHFDKEYIQELVKNSYCSTIKTITPFTTNSIPIWNNQYGASAFWLTNGQAIVKTTSYESFYNGKDLFYGQWLMRFSNGPSNYPSDNLNIDTLFIYNQGRMIDSINNMLLLDVNTDLMGTVNSYWGSTQVDRLTQPLLFDAAQFNNETGDTVCEFVGYKITVNG